MRRIALQGFLFLALLLQMTCSVSAQQNPAPAAPGRLVDLGGFQVHIYCVGHGSPPVILLHGLGDYSFDWALVQPAMAANSEHVRTIVPRRHGVIQGPRRGALEPRCASFTCCCSDQTSRDRTCW